MKTIIEKCSFWNLFIGVILGVGIGMYMFSLLVPSGADMIALYHLKDGAHMDRNGNLLFQGTSSKSSMNMNSHMMPVTSEKQFLEEMIIHHESAVTMSNQVLTLSNLHPEVQTLAKNIISAQTKEITMMKDWLSSWK